MERRFVQAPRRRRTRSTADVFATGLGWFSIALGAAELLAPRAIADRLGKGADARVIRADGAREVLTGVGILMSRDATPWIWGRVAGDALELATLSRGFRSDNDKRARVGMAVGMVAMAGLLDLLCARKLNAANRGAYAVPDYSDRSGFPRSPAEMRGLAAAPRPVQRAEQHLTVH